MVSSALICAKDWVFDSLITFLKCPRWKTPVVSFIEENCLIFDTEEENKLEFTDIHKVSIFSVSVFRSNFQGSSTSFFVS